jgi:hypothetical protein
MVVGFEPMLLPFWHSSTRRRSCLVSAGVYAYIIMNIHPRPAYLLALRHGRIGPFPKAIYEMTLL